MILFSNIYGILFGVLMGLSIALFITVKFVKQSNDIGDSKGEFNDFGDYMSVICDNDNLKHM
ncbi:MAG: hypothetical protein K6G75_11545 [Lachnospiraceae bacterium]|nr:hypothetical protein [Lachnospiraceae bacterium]